MRAASRGGDAMAHEEWREGSRSIATGALRSSRSPAAPPSATLARHGELDRAVDHGAVPAGERLDALAVQLLNGRLRAELARVRLGKVVVDGRLAHVADQPQRLGRRIELHAAVRAARHHPLPTTHIGRRPTRRPPP